MIKFGVVTIEQLKQGRTKSWFGAKKKVSVTLLHQAKNNLSYLEYYDEILHELNDDRGTYKRTYKDRFTKFDDICLQIVGNRYRSSGITVHDIAVSSAQTAVDFFRKLSIRYPSLEYKATDYDPYVQVLRDGRLSVALSSDNRPIEILYPPFVFTPRKLESAVYYPVNHIIRVLLEKTRVRDLISKYMKQELSSESILLIEVFCAEARNLADSDSRFELGKYNLLEPCRSKFQCIRAMNVFNDNYFRPPQMYDAISNVFNSLESGGIFIVGSNEGPESSVSGAVFSKNDQVLKPLWASQVLPSIYHHIDEFNRR